jgi:hypothetical protein
MNQSMQIPGSKDSTFSDHTDHIDHHSIPSFIVDYLRFLFLSIDMLKGSGPSAFYIYFDANLHQRIFLDVCCWSSTELWTFDFQNLTLLVFLLSVLYCWIELMDEQRLGPCRDSRGEESTHKFTAGNQSFHLSTQSVRRRPNTIHHRRK